MLGRKWTLGEAVYLAFKGPKRVVPLFASDAGRTETLAKAQQRMADTLDAIERGEFPPSPDDVYRCEQLRLLGRLQEGTTLATSDASAREHAVDPSRNVVLEASAGTGKTRVLVERYVNLLRAGIEPDHILAITFTRKAAAEMRERIIERLREAARLSQFDAGRWRELKERLGEIAISTIDAFCLSLLREFPLEADVDPGFDLADDTEVPRLIGESLDQALRICRGIARDDDDVALVFAQLGERRLRTGLTALLDRRLVAPQALRRYLSSGPRDLTASEVCRRSADAPARSVQRRAGWAGAVPEGRTGAGSVVRHAGRRRAAPV